MLTRKLLVFPGERIALLLELCNGDTQTSQFSVQSLVLSSYIMQFRGQLIHTPLQVTVQTLDLLQPFYSLIQVGIRLQHDPQRFGTFYTFIITHSCIT